MPIKPCPGCGARVGLKGGVCPRCGLPARKRIRPVLKSRGRKTNVLPIILILVALGIALIAVVAVNSSLFDIESRSKEEQGEREKEYRVLQEGR